MVSHVRPAGAHEPGTTAPVEEAVPTAEEPYAQEIPPARRRRRPTRNQALVGLAVVLAAAVGVVVTLVATSGGASTTTPVSVTTQRVTVSTGNMQQTVSASGTIQPAQQADLQFAVSGQVTAVDVTAGQKVTKGQVLAKVDGTALQYEVNAANATLSSDQARLSTDQANGASTSQIDSDQAAITSAQSQLASAQTNLADANLTATFSGTVAAVNITVGQEVSGGSGSGGSGGTGSSGSGGSGSSGLGSLGGGASSQASSSAAGSASGSTSNDIVVVSTGAYTVNTTVDDTEVAQIQAGDQAVITPGASTTPVYGTVSSVGLIAASGNSTVASFPVVIAVTGSPAGLYAGSSATVSIIVKQLYDVVQVPTGAVSYVNGQATVTRVAGGSQASQAVTTGISASGYTQITSGLKAGDVIISRVVRFNGNTGAGRNILGGGRAGTGTGGAFPGAGGFGGGGFGGGGFGGGFRGGAGGGAGG
jgi:multidrug efflux pump subunit AcrA (membrane-fusion protein)